MQPITIYATRTKTSFAQVEHRDKFQFRPDRPYPRLQRLAIWTLNKLGCYAKVSEKTTSKLYDVDIERISIDSCALLNGICEQNQELLRSYDLKGERLLIGSHDASRILNMPDTR